MDDNPHFPAPEIPFMLCAVHIPGRYPGAGFFQAGIERLHLSDGDDGVCRPVQQEKRGIGLSVTDKRGRAVAAHLWTIGDSPLSPIWLAQFDEDGAGHEWNGVRMKRPFVARRALQEGGELVFLSFSARNRTGNLVYSFPSNPKE